MNKDDICSFVHSFIFYSGFLQKCPLVLCYQELRYGKKVSATFQCSKSTEVVCLVCIKSTNFVMYFFGDARNESRESGESSCQNADEECQQWSMY